MSEIGQLARTVRCSAIPILLQHVFPTLLLLSVVLKPEFELECRPTSHPHIHPGTR